MTPLISLRSVTKTYPLGEHAIVALDRVSLDIRAGEFIAITGSSGSGKSTLMHLLGTLDVPTAGNLFIDGKNVGELSNDDLAGLRSRTIGFVFQSFNLLPRISALRQVMLPLTYTHPRPPDGEALAAMRLAQVGLAHRAHHYPQQLSGGQQQRVAIARALINNPQILLADEPTGALDSRTSDEIMTLFGKLNEAGITVVVVTHDHDVAKYARRQIVVRDGRVVSDGPSNMDTASQVPAEAAP